MYISCSNVKRLAHMEYSTYDTHDQNICNMVTEPSQKMLMAKMSEAHLNTLLLVRDADLHDAVTGLQHQIQLPLPWFHMPP